MRRFIRPATSEEEKLVNSHLAQGDILLGVHDSQNVYAIREPSGNLRFVDYDSVKPGLVQRFRETLGI